jgi:DNA-binding response OmpR family regulator
MTLQTYAKILQLAGYLVMTGLGSESGLRAVAANPPDAILLDLRMPGVDGVAFLRQLRARPEWASLPVAIITGDYLTNDETTAAELATLGAKVYFKPLWLEELTAVVKDLLETHRPTKTS